MTAYTVLVSLDAGETWRVVPDEVEAASPDAAITRHREKQSPQVKTNPDAQYVATTRWAPRQMQKQLIEKWALGPVEPDGQTKMEDEDG